MKNVALIVLILVVALGAYLVIFEPDTLDRLMPKDQDRAAETAGERRSGPEVGKQPADSRSTPATAVLEVDLPPVSWFFNGEPLPQAQSVTVPAGSGVLTGFTTDGYLHQPLDLRPGETRQLQISEIRQRPASSWETFQGDGRRTGFVRAKSRDQLTPRWELGLGSSVSASPIIAGDTVYIATDKRAAVAVRISDGVKLWEADQTGSDVAPVTNGAYLFTGNDNGQFAGFRLDDGKQKGFTSLGSYPVALAPASEEMFLAVTRENVVYAVATKKSLFGKLPLKILWDTPLPSLAGSDASPLIVGDRVILQTGDGLVALDVESGRVLWPAGLTSGESMEPVADMSLSVVDSSLFRTPTPAAGNGAIYAAIGANLTAFALEDGRPVWQKETGSKITSSISLANGLIYAGCSDGSIHAFSAADGRPVFRAEVSEQAIFSSPVLFADRLLVGTRAGKVFLLHALSGEIIASSDQLTGTPIHATPAVLDDAILVINQGGKVVCYQ